VSLRAGVDLARVRLREPGTRVAAALGVSFVIGVALLERAQGRSGAADRALSGGAFGIALPLFCYFVVGRACAGASLRDAVLSLARHGVNRTELVLGLALVTAAAGAAFAALSALVVVTLTRGFSDPLLLRDGVSSVWIGIVSGAAYTAALLGASAFGRRGQGRAWLLAADFVLGAGSSFFALPWPKGHIRNLLGGAPVLEQSQLSALIMLLGTSFAFLWFGARRAQR
jgi:hypothetical protein